MITSQRCWFERGALKGRDGFNDNSCVFFHLQLLNVVKNFVFHYIEWDLTNNSSILNKSKLVLSNWYGFLIEIKEQEGEIKSSKPYITHFESIYQAECRVIAMDWFRPTRHPPRRDLLGKRYPISYIWINNASYILYHVLRYHQTIHQLIFIIILLRKMLYLCIGMERSRNTFFNFIILAFN